MLMVFINRNRRVAPAIGGERDGRSDHRRTFLCLSNDARRLTMQQKMG